MTALTSHDPSAFIALLDEQCGLYDQIKHACQRQADLIACGDTQGLMVVLQERQALIDAVSVLNRRLIPHREAWARGVDQAPPDVRLQVKTLLDQIQALLAEILTQDESDRQSLQSRMNAVSGALQQVGQGAAAAKAYGMKKMAMKPQFADRTG